MSTNTIIQDGIVEALQYPVTVWDLDDKSWHHNPSIARDDTGKIWVSARYHDELPAIRYANPQPYSHPTSWLMVGILDEKTLTVSGVKRMKPAKGSPIYIVEKEIEDVRIFWRKDGLHGIGDVINAHGFDGETRVYEVEILIDYAKGTYKLLKDYGYIKGHMEKNWTPPTVFAPHFDYIYSPTEVVLEGKVYGEEYTGSTHGGSQALPYKDGFIRIAHQVVNMPDITHRWYVSVAELIDKRGYVTHNSQFFDLCTGWRPQIRESVEFVSGIVWSKGKEDKELLVSYGLRDETCAFVKIPIDVFRWTPFNPDVRHYQWRFEDSDPPTDSEYWIGGNFNGPVYGN
jgi:hypothetical protein